MKVTLIEKFYGYCPGLKRSLQIAYKLADKAKKEKKKIYFDVPLAHNENVEQGLEKKGFTQVKLGDDSDGRGNYFLVSAHGASYDKINRLRNQNFSVISATCSTVRRVQDLAIEDHKNGYQTVIFGKKDHAEIVGVNGCVGDSAIIVKDLTEAGEVKLTGKASILSQTTFPSREFEEAVKIIKKNNPKQEIVVHETICPIVEGRVNIICRYAKKQKPDKAVVVGSTTSSNTKQLYNKLSEIVPSILIGDETEIKKSDFANTGSVLVVSGTSAPPEVVRAVAEKLKNFA